MVKSLNRKNLTFVDQMTFHRCGALALLTSEDHLGFESWKGREVHLVQPSHFADEETDRGRN